MRGARSTLSTDDDAVDWAQGPQRFPGNDHATGSPRSAEGHRAPSSVSNCIYGPPWLGVQSCVSPGTARTTPTAVSQDRQVRLEE